ncbi:hypothetical protein ILUMI_19570, partial [Ignelater luminosus]
SIPIPEDRVRTVAPFQVTGVDLAGPMHLRGGKKVWIVLYTCNVYRAVPLGHVHSLSTEAFLQSLRRFIVRRKCPWQQNSRVRKITDIDMLGRVGHEPKTHNEEAGGVHLLFPTQFIQDNPIVCLPEAILVEEKLLRQRNRQIEELDVVLVEAEGKKRLECPLGVIMKTYPGKDEVVRTVLVRTKDGLYSGSTFQKKRYEIWKNRKTARVNSRS